MTLLTLSKIDKYFKAEPILKGISFQVQEGEKAGLIGPNGSGKTTLLKIIAGELEADSGEIHLARDIKIGYLPQQPPQIPAGTLRSHLEHPLRAHYRMRKEIEDLGAAIEAAAEKEGKQELQDRLARYADLTSRYEREGGYEVESRLIGVARGLGFQPQDFGRELSSFSGGEKTRARLGGLLLQSLDLLLLDEPTNFLDLDAIQWLEKYLRDQKTALLVVSHDRFFLDRVVSGIYAIRNHSLKNYSGNYSTYQKKYEQEQLEAAKAYQQQELLRAREERLVREAKGDERSKKQARSRQKKLDRLSEVQGTDRIDNFKINLDYSGRSGRQVVNLVHVSKSFDQKTLFKEISLAVRWGDRVALVGPNGSGKSTLLKIISGNIKPDHGTVNLGPSVKMSYFDQEQEKLNPASFLLDTITAASEFDQREARNHLGRYLFRGDDVYKRISELSGGERSRLSLARLALDSGNCLLMDEPTSHLDLPALEELENVLSGYPGTLIVVSHDRYFLSGLINRVFELNGGRLSCYDCTFGEYLNLKEKTYLEPQKDDQRKQREKLLRREEHHLKREEHKKMRRLKERQARLETDIETTESEIADLEKVLSNPELYGDHNRLHELGTTLEEAEVKLASLLRQWEETVSALEEAGK